MQGKDRIQILWGVVLVMAGLGVFYRIPQVMPRVEEMPAFTNAAGLVRFCFYMLGGLLVFGGGRKLVLLYRKLSG